MGVPFGGGRPSPTDKLGKKQMKDQVSQSVSSVRRVLSYAGPSRTHNPENRKKASHESAKEEARSSGS